MPSSVEKLEGLKRRLTVTVPAEEIEKAYQSRLKKVAKSAKLPGFRPGKVPQKVLEQRHGKAVLQEIANELMQSSLRTAIEEHKLQMAGMPKVDMGEILPGKPFEYVVNFEVYPEINLKSLNGEAVEHLKTEVTNKDVDKMLESLRKQHANWETVDRPAKSGDQVVIDFEGTIDGKSFDRGSAKDFQLELGSKRMIPGFEEGIEGMKPSETKAIDVTFPKNYPGEELAGKKAVFNITVQKIMEPELPALDDQFAEKLGIKGGLKALRDEVKKNMEKEVHRVLENKLKMAVLDKLVEHNPIEVPDALVEAEIGHLQQMTRQQMTMQGRKPEEVEKADLPRDPYKAEAEKRVVLGLLLAEVIKQHEIKASQDQVKARIEEIAASYQKPEEVVSWYYNNKKMLSEVESVVLEEQAVDQLLSQLEVKDKVVSYEEAVQQAQQ